MEEIEMNSYNFYIKNFPYIKYSIDEKFVNQMDKLMIVIFYDNDLYKKYLTFRKDDDFTRKLKEKFSRDAEVYNNEEDGVFIICGEISETIDLVINKVFSEKNGLNEEELKSINVLGSQKSNSLFYITIAQIKFFDSDGNMHFKFKELQKAFSNENEDDI